MDSIENIEDVKTFFRFLYEEKKLAFHLDEFFDGYVSWGDDKLAFSSSECEKYDNLMDVFQRLRNCRN